MLKTIPTPGETSWFTHDRFGLFIHFGTYALAARHEWIKQFEQVEDEPYMKYFHHFDPDLYDPDQWADAAVAAGMKYFLITTKHHEGFSLWDTRLSDYKSTNTPYGKDILRPMVDAFRARGLRIGFYHSLIDWHHEHFTVDDMHPQRNHPDREEMNRGRDIARYARFLHGQVRELLTEFGQLDILWCDFSYPSSSHGRPDNWVGKGRDDWQSEKLRDMIRDLAPNIILNDRMDLEEGWDVKTPEQVQPTQWVHFNGKPVVWEACQTFSGSWGYHRDESSWKSVDMLVQMLIDTVSKGGNLVLNVGPTGRGEFDQRAIDRLNGIGQWMKRHARSIYGCTQAPEPFTAPTDARLTYNPDTNRLYVHLFAWPFKHLHLEGLGGKVAYAQLLNDASELLLSQEGAGHNEYLGTGADTLRIELPVTRPPVTVPVVELFLK